MTLRDWTLKKAQGPHGTYTLALFSFAEAIFFPIPPDVVLIAILSLREGKKWLWYGFTATLWSVVGGVVGYLFGVFFFDTAGNAILSINAAEKYLLPVQELFVDHAFISIFLAGFTPIPYKVFTLSAGFFRIDFLTFVVASLLSRGIRFFAVAYIIKVFGKEVGAFTYKYFNTLTVLLGVIIVFAAVFVAVFG